MPLVPSKSFAADPSATSSTASGTPRERPQPSSSSPGKRKAPGRTKSSPLYLAPPEEQKLRVGIALDAAKVGQLTRLKEQVVEVTAEERRKQQKLNESKKDSDWNNRTGLAQKDLVKSDFFQVIHEAAALGRLRPIKPLITTTTQILDDSQHSATTLTTTQSEDYYNQQQRKKALVEANRKALAEKRGSIVEAAMLVDSYVEAQKEYKKEVLLSAEAQLERLVDMQASKLNLSLLSPTPPSLKKKVAAPVTPKASAGKLDMHLSPVPSATAAPVTPHDQLRKKVTLEAANTANDRTIRILTCQTLKIKAKCSCGYCGNPSPYQTQYYKQLRKLGPERKEEALKAAQTLDLTKPTITTTLEPPLLETHDENSSTATPEQDEEEDPLVQQERDRQRQEDYSNARDTVAKLFGGPQQKSDEDYESKWLSSEPTWQQQERIEQRQRDFASAQDKLSNLFYRPPNPSSPQQPSADPSSSQRAAPSFDPFAQDDDQKDNPNATTGLDQQNDQEAFDPFAQQESEGQGSEGGEDPFDGADEYVDDDENGVVDEDEDSEDSEDMEPTDSEFYNSENNTASYDEDDEVDYEDDEEDENDEDDPIGEVVSLDSDEKGHRRSSHRSSGGSVGSSSQASPANFSDGAFESGSFSSMGGDGETQTTNSMVYSQNTSGHGANTSQATDGWSSATSFVTTPSMGATGSIVTANHNSGSLVGVDSGDESDTDDEEANSMNQSGEIQSHPKDLENHPRWKQQEDVAPESPVSPEGHVKAVRRNSDMTPQTPHRQSSKRFGFESSNEDASELHAVGTKTPSKDTSTIPSEPLLPPKTPLGQMESSNDRLKFVDEENFVLASDAQELADLLELQRDGEEIDEDRLYELQLFDWHKNGWSLTAEELSDLEFFREERRAKYQGLGSPAGTSTPQTPTVRIWNSSRTKSPLDSGFHEDDSEGQPKETTTRSRSNLEFDMDEDSSKADSFGNSLTSLNDDTVTSSEQQGHTHGQVKRVLSQFLQNQLKEIEQEDEDIVSRDATLRTMESDQPPAWRPLQQKDSATISSVGTSDASTLYSGGNLYETKGLASRMDKDEDGTDSAKESSDASDGESDLIGNGTLSRDPHAGNSAKSAVERSSENRGSNERDKGSFDDDDASQRSFPAPPEIRGSQNVEDMDMKSPSKSSSSLRDHFQKHSPNGEFDAESFDDPTFPGAAATKESKASSARAPSSTASSKTSSKGADQSDLSASTASEDRRRQEDEELDELNELYDLRDAGEDIDENRLYELEIFDRFRQGEPLTAIEQEDLDFYQKRRKRVKRQVKEYNRLCDLQDAGEEVDQDRLYLLELVVRDRLRESLTQEEIQDLEAFEAAEEVKEANPNGASASKQSQEPLGSDATDSAVKDTGKNHSLQAPTGDDDSSLSSREVDELNELLEGFEAGKPIDTVRLRELDVFDRWKNGEEIDALDGFELQIYRKKRRKERAYRREFQHMLDRKENGEVIDEQRLLCLALFARQFVGEDLDDDEFALLEEFQRKERSLDSAFASREANVQKAVDSVASETAIGSETGHSTAVGSLSLRVGTAMEPRSPEPIATDLEATPSMEQRMGARNPDTIREESISPRDVPSDSGPSHMLPKLKEEMMKLSAGEKDSETQSVTEESGIVPKPEFLDENQGEANMSSEGTPSDSSCEEAPIVSEGNSGIILEEDSLTGKIEKPESEVNHISMKADESIEKDSRGSQASVESEETSSAEIEKPESEVNHISMKADESIEKDSRGSQASVESEETSSAEIEEKKFVRNQDSASGNEARDKIEEDECEKNQDPIEADDAIAYERKQDSVVEDQVKVTIDADRKIEENGFERSLESREEDEAEARMESCESQTNESTEENFKADRSMLGDKESDLSHDLMEEDESKSSKTDEGESEKSQGLVEDDEVTGKIEDNESQSSESTEKDSTKPVTAVEKVESEGSENSADADETSGGEIVEDESEGSSISGSDSSGPSKDVGVSQEPIQSFGSDDSSLSSREIDELNDLLDAFEEGKSVDKARMRELDVYDRWKNGEDLDELDEFELQIYRKKRRKERNYRREFQNILDKKERGEQVDEHRLSCLALFARQFLGEELNDDEWFQLQEFHRRERSLDSALKEKPIDKSKKPAEAPNHSSSSITETLFHAESVLPPSDEALKAISSIPATHPPRDDSSGDEGSSQASVGGKNDENIRRDNDAGLISSPSLRSLTRSSRLRLSAGNDDSSLSSRELDELNELLEDHEEGKTVDTQRMRELDIFDRWKNGEHLDELDGFELQIYRKKRRRERRYRREFHEILDKKERGEDIDDRRLACLALFARQFLGEELDENELLQLEELYRQDLSLETSRMTKTTESLVQDDAANKLPLETAISYVEEATLASGRHKGGSTKAPSDSDDEDSVEVSDAVSNRQSYVQSNSEIEDVKIPANIPSDGDDSSRHLRLEVETAVAQHESLSSQPPKPDDTKVVGPAKEADSDTSTSDESDTATGLVSDEIFVVHKASASIEPSDSRGPVVDPPGLTSATSPDSTNKNFDSFGALDDHFLPYDFDEDSSLSSGEQQELDDLTAKYEDGEDVNETRLYELDLFNRWSRGEDFASDEIERLRSFKRARMQERKIRKEFETLLNRKENGEPVDEDRLYCLELYAKRHIGQELLPDEVVLLQAFESGATTQESMLPLQASGEPRSPDQAAKSVSQESKSEDSSGVCAAKVTTPYPNDSFIPGEGGTFVAVGRPSFWAGVSGPGDAISDEIAQASVSNFFFDERSRSGSQQIEYDDKNDGDLDSSSSSSYDSSTGDRTRTVAEGENPDRFIGVQEQQRQDIVALVDLTDAATGAVPSVDSESENAHIDKNLDKDEAYIIEEPGDVSADESNDSVSSDSLGFVNKRDLQNDHAQVFQASPRAEKVPEQNNIPSPRKEEGGFFAGIRFDLFSALRAEQQRKGTEETTLPEAEPNTTETAEEARKRIAAEARRAAERRIAEEEAKLKLEEDQRRAAEERAIFSETKRLAVEAERRKNENLLDANTDVTDFTDNGKLSLVDDEGLQVRSMGLSKGYQSAKSDTLQLDKEQTTARHAEEDARRFEADKTRPIESADKAEGDALARKAAEEAERLEKIRMAEDEARRLEAAQKGEEVRRLEATRKAEEEARAKRENEQRQEAARLFALRQQKEEEIAERRRLAEETRRKAEEEERARRDEEERQSQFRSQLEEELREAERLQEVAVQAERHRDEVRRRMEEEEERLRRAEQEARFEREEEERREAAHQLALQQMAEEAERRKEEARKRIEEEERLRRVEEEARFRREEEERREAAHQLALQQMAEEAERRKEEARKRMKEEERLRRAEEEARFEREEEERREAAHQLALQQMAEEAERRKEEARKRQEEEARFEEERIQAEKEEIRLQEKNRRRREAEARRQAASTQALAAQAMAQRMQMEREEKARQKEEAAKREAEMARKRERLDEARRKRQDEERSRKEQEVVLGSVPREAPFPNDPPEDSEPKHVQKLKPQSGVLPASGQAGAPRRPTYSFTSATSTRRYNKTREGNSQGDPQGRSRLKIIVRPLLSWRSDPAESFSDWKVEVRQMGTHAIDEYHVHRNIVGFGPRKSGYFAKQFLQFNQKVRTNPSMEPVSRLVVPVVEAKVFGFVLDYLYLTEGQTQPTLTAERAAAVYKVAERLEMPTLQTTVAEFYRKHLSAANMGKFLRAANKVKADKLAFLAKARIGSIITQDPTLARMIKPRFLAQLADILDDHRQKILQNVQKTRPDAIQSLEHGQSKQWSRAIYCCSIAKDNVFTPDILERLLDERTLPAIDGSVALEILRLNFKVMTFHSDSRHKSLERRCTDGILEDWTLFRRGFKSQEQLKEAIMSVLSIPMVKEIMDREQRMQQQARR